MIRVLYGVRVNINISWCCDVRSTLLLLQLTHRSRTAAEGNTYPGNILLRISAWSGVRDETRILMHEVEWRVFMYIYICIYVVCSLQPTFVDYIPTRYILRSTWGTYVPADQITACENVGTTLLTRPTWSYSSKKEDNDQEQQRGKNDLAFWSTSPHDEGWGTKQGYP